MSRYASALDGLARKLTLDPAFVQIRDRDLVDGQHRNNSNHPDYFTTAYFHRPEDLQAEYAAISDWVRRAFDRYQDRLSVKVIDAASIEGLIKSIRHRARRFPAFIIDGHDRIIGFDPSRLDAALAQRLTGTEGGESRTQHA